MIKRELIIFFTAVMFYTRIPVPRWTGYSEENLNRATRYFPFMGILVGGVGAGVFILAHLVLGVFTSVIFSLVAMVLLTGAFHEDGLADFCDGFGGGYTREEILEIMKDSRIGTYGTIALIFLFLIKLFLLGRFDSVQIPWILITAHACSRLNPVLLIFTSRYVRENDQSKAKPIGKKSSGAVLPVAAIFALAPLALFIGSGLNLGIVLGAVIVVQLLILIGFRYYIHLRLGGYTGDVLGALQQLSETGYYLTCMVAIELL